MRDTLLNNEVAINLLHDQNPHRHTQLIEEMRYLHQIRHANVANYLSLQNTFMAMWKDTFERIQDEPAFSRSGKKNTKRLLRAWLDGGNEEFEALWKQIFNSPRSRRHPLASSPTRVKTRSSRSELLRATQRKGLTPSTGGCITNIVEVGNPASRC